MPADPSQCLSGCDIARDQVGKERCHTNCRGAVIPTTQMLETNAPTNCEPLENMPRVIHVAGQRVINHVLVRLRVGFLVA